MTFNEFSRAEMRKAAQVTLVECPIGLFEYAGELCLKTEYGNNEGRIDAYIVSSGEFFWGDPPQTIASQRAQLVTPVCLASRIDGVPLTSGRAPRNPSKPSLPSRRPRTRTSAPARGPETLTKPLDIGPIMCHIETFYLAVATACASFLLVLLLVQMGVI